MFECVWLSLFLQGRKHREDDDPIQYTNFFPSSFFPLPPPQKRHQSMNCLDSVQDNKTLKIAGMSECVWLSLFLQGRKHREDDDPIQYTNFFPSSFFPLPPPQKRHQSMNCLDSVQDNKKLKIAGMSECVWLSLFLQGRKHREDDDPIQYTNFFPSSFFPLPPPQKRHQSMNCLDSVQDNKKLKNRWNV
ncbi:hypothetical protein TNCV_2484021 [Trichonephila clavipes]|uniref:Uncharacterized protein n=1 Tax=Trichonephila clavipes TaxID=2585209 RepID=A0A8X6VZ68_TRICX|nr:hypothetical protein TNCV_2484021 [Trichonephila clavipes]